MRTSPLLLLSLAGLLACSYDKPGATSSTADTGPTPVPADSLTASPASPVGRVEPTGAVSPVGTAPAGAATTAADWPLPFRPDVAQLCAQTAKTRVVIYQRPSASAPKFGQLAAGETVKLAARTADGWVGFDPATAQAANVGLLRLRWVRATEAFSAPSVCAQLPVVALPTGCLLMAAEPVVVRAEQRVGSAVLSTIPAGSYARVEARHDGWLRITVPGQRVPGFVAAAANLNGPCE